MRTIPGMVILEPLTIITKCRPRFAAAVEHKGPCYISASAVWPWKVINNQR